MKMIVVKSLKFTALIEPNNKPTISWLNPSANEIKIALNAIPALIIIELRFPDNLYKMCAIFQLIMHL